MSKGVNKPSVIKNEEILNIINKEPKDFPNSTRKKVEVLLLENKNPPKPLNFEDRTNISCVILDFTKFVTYLMKLNNEQITKEELKESFDLNIDRIINNLFLLLNNFGSNLSLDQVEEIYIYLNSFLESYIFITKDFLTESLYGYYQIQELLDITQKIRNKILLQN